MTSITAYLLLLASSQLSTTAAVPGDTLSAKVIECTGCSNPTVADDLSVCDIDACTDAHANSVTVTEGFTVTAGFSTVPITGTTSFDWSKAVGSSDTYSFTIGKGDDGHIEFIPLLNKICGTLTSYGITTGPYGDLCTTTKTGTDPNACGTSGAKLDDGTADGTFTFCNTNGTGCNPFKNTGGSKMVLD